MPKTYLPYLDLRTAPIPAGPELPTATWWPTAWQPSRVRAPVCGLSELNGLFTGHRHRLLHQHRQARARDRSPNSQLSIWWRATVNFNAHQHHPIIMSPCGRSPDLGGSSLHGGSACQPQHSTQLSYDRGVRHSPTRAASRQCVCAELSTNQSSRYLLTMKGW
jgi:hypothetical protein